MRIEVARRAGFCFGVKRAIELAVRTLAQAAPGSVYSVGDIIHNPQTVAQLAGMGLRVVDSIDQIPAGATLLVRSHGLDRRQVAAAEARGVRIVDATCPDVRKAQLAAEELREAGYQVVIVGDPGHPEVEALQAEAGPASVLVAGPEAVAGLRTSGRIGVVAQTTQPPAKVEACIEALRRTGAEVVAQKTTCGATQRRQEEAASMAKAHPVMVVVGGRKSANTTKLAELCRAAGARTYHVEDPREIEPEWFAGVDSVGITAGASTPDWIIEEVVDKMAELENNPQLPQETEEAQAKAEPEGTQAETAPVTDGDEGRAQMEAALEHLKRNARVTGKVAKVEPDKVYVDIGAKTDGVIPLRELTFRQVDSAVGLVAEGDEIEVVVLRPENEQGEAILSKRRVDEERAWERLTAAKESGETIDALVTEKVKGGLVVDVGVRGFIPGSQVSREFIEDLSSFVGQRLACKVLEVDRGKRSVILSHRQVAEEEARLARENALKTLQPGAVVPGVVKRLTSFGAFVDLGGVEGLLHVSELAWNRVKHPSEVLQEGQEIKVKVLKVDPETGRISLGYRQTLPDPWTEAATKYHPGETVTGEVVRVVDFGAFVRLEDGLEGLVHVSQLAHERVAKASDAVKPGEKVEVKILAVDPEKKRISLSIKQALPAPVREERAPRRHEREEAETAPLAGADVPAPTLGDVFGHIFAKGGFGAGGDDKDTK
ncbi:MAG: bifunctional 4-hydroxy-3-methylbut-2-enyl diphosphate reductase/30S ribosomal protein S1 [Chitinophagales bacterium]